jgi:hypothetical protein
MCAEQERRQQQWTATNTHHRHHHHQHWKKWGSRRDVSSPRYVFSFILLMIMCIGPVTIIRMNGARDAMHLEPQVFFSPIIYYFITILPVLGSERTMAALYRGVIFDTTRIAPQRRIQSRHVAL